MVVRTQKEDMGEEQEEESELRRLATLVETLIVTSDTTKSFVGKWQSIRAKLEDLRSGLSTAAEPNPGSGSCSVGDSVLRELIKAISITVTETQELARLCSGDELYSGGKLIMRSNLDLSAAKFDLHSKSLAGIYASGILSSDSKAIVVSKPVFGGGREMMRFYLRDMFWRLKNGDLDMKTRALTALVEAFGEDEKCVRIVVSESLEILDILCSYLDSRELRIQEGSVEAISTVAGFDFVKPTLILAGVIPPLVRILETGSELGKEKATRSLMKLTENSDNAWSVSANGGVPLVLNICATHHSSNLELVSSACGVLRNLVGVSEIRKFMIESGAVPIFSNIIRTSNEESSLLHAMEFLQSICSKDDKAKKQFTTDPTGIDSLLRLLESSPKTTSKVRQKALQTIGDVCLSTSSSPDNSNSNSNSLSRVLNSGFLQRLVFLLKKGDSPTQESALKLAAQVCVLSEDAKKVMGEAGCMPELVKLLDESRPVEIRETAANVLSCLVSVQKNRRKFIEEEQNVNRILQVLNRQTEDKNGTKKFLLNALMLLSDTNSGRRKINASEHVRNLEKLAETNVPDAKRIVKKLSGTGSRLRNLLQGIWNT